MRPLRGFIRLFLSAAIAVLLVTVVLLVYPFPVRIRGAKLGSRLVTTYARYFMAIHEIKVHCPTPEKLERWEGFIFANHRSYLDILLLLYVAPVRFLAKYEVKLMPIVGAAARAIDTVFVKRGDKKSRAAARKVLVATERFPPICLFPEGKTNRTEELLLPLRYGAFEIVVSGEIPFLTCAIAYDRPEIVEWRGEGFVKAIWRLATREGPVQAHLVPIQEVRPEKTQDPIQLSLETHRSMTAAIRRLIDSL